MAKIDVGNVKKGTVLDVDGNLFRVVDTSHTHTGRGSATYSFKVKNVITGATNNLTYKSGTTLDSAEVNTKNATFLYSTGDTYVFMENDTSEMYELPYEEVEDIANYLKENLDIFLMIHEGNVIGVILPTVITYTISETVPGVKGDRASGGKKPATLETGLQVNIPLHLSEGEEVKLNTTTGEVTT